jgi:fibroblast growth factor receptor 1
VTAKNEVLVSILNQNATQKDTFYTPKLPDVEKNFPKSVFFPNNNRNIPPPPPLNTPYSGGQVYNYGVVEPPVSPVQTKTYQENPTNFAGNIDSTNTTIRLQPTQNDRNRTYYDVGNNQTDESSTFSYDKHMNDNKEIPVIAVILVICVIFLIAGIVAVFMFRKNLCAIGKTLKKKSKLDQAKKSNQSNGSSNNTEDSRNSIVMNHWNGPTAFGNRYTTPWDRDNPHMQVNLEPTIF